MMPEKRRAIASEPLAATAIRFEWIEDSEGFRALEPEWRALCERDGGHGFFQRYDWQWRIWTRVATARGRRLCILVGRSQGQVVLLWPLMRDRRQVRMLASDKVEYRDLIVEHGPDTRAWVAAAWNRVRGLRGVDLFLFQDIRNGSNLDQFMRSSGSKGWRHDCRSRLIRLSRYSGWNDYARTLPKKMINDQKRQWRRIAMKGEVRCEILGSADKIRATIDWMIHYKLAWLRANRISDDTFGSPEYVGFIHDVIQQAFEARILHFSTLCVDNAIVAGGFGYKFGTEFTFHMFTYNDAWQSFSPGRLLQEHVIKWCFENGVTTFDFMPGEESYKGIWADEEFIVTDYLIPATLRGSALVRWHASGLSSMAEQNWLKAAYRYLPRCVRQKLMSALMAHREYAGQVRRIDAGG